jgi:predicted TIM-barrel fold metal-dependent hydrolase
MPVAATRIDVHHHMVPGPYAQWLRDMGVKPGGVEVPEWTSQKSLKFMNRMNVQTAILSVSTPGVWLGEQSQATRWATWLNDSAAHTVRMNPRRFGFFATLPLPDVDAAITEAQRCLDDLTADGILLFSNTDGHYLGDPCFRPLMEFLNDRHAVVFIHPADLPAVPVPGVAPFAADLPMDVTRTALSLITSGSLETFENIRFILAYAGGLLPFIGYRVLLAQLQNESRTSQMLAYLHRRRQLPERVKILQRFYYDLALSSTSATLPGLLDVAGDRRVLFGTDFPFAPTPAVRMMADQYDQYELSLYQRQNIDYRNAYSLFPRLAAA